MGCYALGMEEWKRNKYDQSAELGRSEGSFRCPGLHRVSLTSKGNETGCEELHSTLWQLDSGHLMP